MRNIDKIIVHCSATPEGRDVSTEEIKRWHTEERGWDDIGYHWVVELDSSIKKKEEETKKYLALIVEDKTAIVSVFAMLEVLMQKVSQKIQEHLIKKKLWLSYYQI